jgi:predicted nucleotidyltransferase
MITTRQIEELCEQIVREFNPYKIVLFGSHAYGHASTDSDVDLLVIMPFEGRSTRQAIRILNKLSVLVPIDLLVQTPKQVEERLEIDDRFMREIVERGKVMYEAHHPCSSFTTKSFTSTKR